MGPLGSAAAWPVALWAQQPAIPVIGYLSGKSASVEASTLAAFREGRRTFAAPGWTVPIL